MSGSLLITGASGFIGRHVAQEALTRGYRVTGVDRAERRQDDIEFVRADIRDRDRMLEVMTGKERVVHLAAVTSNVEFMRKPADCYDVNVNGFLNVLDAAARAGCERLAYASSAAVYLDGFSEDTVIELTRQNNHYAKSKIMNEMMAQSYADIAGMRTVGLRFFNVYGNGENDKGDYASIITIFLKAKRNGKPLVIYGDGSQARDLVNVADAARVTVDLLERGSERVYNVGTGVANPYLAIAEKIDRDAVAFVPNPLTSYQRYTRADTTRLRTALGRYSFLSLEEGMRQMGADLA
jgi:nucleoside-diphosphate-sugar epimerase